MVDNNKSKSKFLNKHLNKIIYCLGLYFKLYKTFRA